MVKQYFCNFVEKAAGNPQVLLQDHLNLLRNHNDLLSPSKACVMCHLRVPAYTATCQHKLCDSCVDLLRHQNNDTQHSAYLICQKGDILIKTRSVAVRALILHGRTPRAMIGFLFRLRRALLGLLEEYFDIIVASDKGMSYKKPQFGLFSHSFSCFYRCGLFLLSLVFILMPSKLYRKEVGTHEAEPSRPELIGMLKPSNSLARKVNL